MSVGQMLERKERPPFVSFHRVPVEDKAASRAAGHYVAKDVDFVHVTPPYSKDLNKFEVPDWFAQLDKAARNNRIPQEWLDHFKKAYDAWKSGKEIPLNGTPILGWGVISPAQQETLIRLGILTVEDLGGVNDEGMRRIGMSAGEFRNKARAWLAQIGDKGPLTMEMAALKQENATLNGQVATLQRQVSALMAGMPAPAVEAPVAEAIVASDLIDAEPTRAELEAAYKAKFGKVPHPAINEATLRARVKE